MMSRTWICLPLFLHATQAPALPNTGSAAISTAAAAMGPNHLSDWYFESILEPAPSRTAVSLVTGSLPATGQARALPTGVLPARLLVTESHL
jgi:hypothetical protein